MCLIRTIELTQHRFLWNECLFLGGVDTCFEQRLFAFFIPLLRPLLPKSSPKCVQVPEYFEVIECPITVSSLLETLEAGLAPGEGDLVDSFIVSVRRMWEDCWSFNHEGTKVITLPRAERFTNDVFRTL